METNHLVEIQHSYGLLICGFNMLFAAFMPFA
jgi:hypothetical protein